MPFGKVPYLFYPRVYCVTDILNVVGRQEAGGEDQGDGQALEWGYFTDESGQTMVKPRVLAGRLEKLTKQDAYVMDNGEYINLLIQSQVPEQFTQEVSFIYIFHLSYFNSKYYRYLPVTLSATMHSQYNQV